MSQVNADTIRKSDGSLGTDIRIKNTSVYESDGGTSVTQNLVQGLIKVWCYTPNDGASINDSFNVSSVTDAATGQTVVNMSNAMANANYSIGHTTYTNIVHSWVSGDDQAASNYRTRAYDGSSYQDNGFRSQAAGDLA